MERKQTNLIVVHCSATRPDHPAGAREIDKWHKAKGWKMIGYHYVVRQDGSVELGRDEAQVGAHAFGYNKNSVGICLEGGLNPQGKSAMNFTDVQLATLRGLIDNLLRKYPAASVVGHRDLSPDIDGDGVIEKWEWLKDCPCLDVAHWMDTGNAVFKYTPP